MKGIRVDCSIREIEEIDDGLPMPEYPPYVEPEGLDLVEAAQKLEEIDALKVRIEKLEKIK